MNRAIRDELLQVLSRFSEHAPELRFGQLIANLAFLARSSGPSDVWDVDDEEMLEAARSHLRDLESRTEALRAARRSDLTLSQSNLLGRFFAVAGPR